MLELKNIYKYYNPDKRSFTPNFICISPVAIPASVPAKKLNIKARSGSIPFTIKNTLTAAPSGKLPSTVRSGKSKII